MVKGQPVIPLVPTYVDDMTFPAEERHSNIPDTCLTFGDVPKIYSAHKSMALRLVK